MKKTALLLLLSLVLTACHSSREVTTTPTGTTSTTPATTTVTPSRSTTAADDYVARVNANAQTASAVTARIKMTVNAGGKELSAGGTLRMKRDDVVQLSLTFMGFEVGRMEFYPQNVLIIDRYNHRYVRAAYSDVTFLKQAGLDFSALQSLFWGELFVPGQTAVPTDSDFSLSASGDHTLLTLLHGRSLDYDFLTNTAAATLSRLTVRGKSSGSRGTFVWNYDGYTPLDGHPFPTTMECAVSGLSKNYGFSLTLSKLGNDTNWEGHTTLSDKYTEYPADAILGALLGGE